MNVRLSLRELDLPENARKKNDFLKAWKIIQELPPSNPNSYWSIATYHGMPFKGRKVSPLNPSLEIPVWGGYCQHANALFPTWHRFYCLRLEQALQTVLPDGDVALHYWDQTSEETLQFGIPEIAVNKTVMIDGVEVRNPLRSFTIPREIIGKKDSFYNKPAGYTTTRYPYSGIRNPEVALDLAMKHNEKINNISESSDKLLQENVIYWLNHGKYPQRSDHPDTIYKEFLLSMEEPDYNRFSNTSSSTVSIEQPHNDVHLVIGGAPYPELNSDGSVHVDDDGEVIWSSVQGARGDIADTETSSYDPMFFLHHSNMDRLLWAWQKKWGHTNDLDIYPEGPNSGTSKDGANNQGMTPDQTPDEVLGMDTVLTPFQDEFGEPRTSRSGINIEELGYTYSIGSFDKEDWPAPKFTEEQRIKEKVHSWQEIEDRLKDAREHRKGKNIPIRGFFDCTNMSSVDPKPASCGPFLMHENGAKRRYYVINGGKYKARNFVNVDKLDKGSISGSFRVQAYYRKNEKLFYLGQRSVLNRWDRTDCANCQRHRDATVAFVVDEEFEDPFELKNLLILVINGNPAKEKLNVVKLAESIEYKGELGKEKPGISLITELVEDIDAE